MNTLLKTVLVALVLSAPTYVSGAPSGDPKTSEWNEVSRLHVEFNRAHHEAELHKGNAELANAQKKVAARAYFALSQFLQRWEPNPPARLIYFEGLYAEGAWWLQDAQIAYVACRRHPGAKNETLADSGSEVTVDSFCMKGLDRLAAKRDASTHAGGQWRYAVLQNLSAREQFSSNFTYAQCDRKDIPLDAARSIAHRRAPLGEPAHVVARGREALGDLPVAVAKNDEFVVFAVAGTDQQARFLLDHATALQADVRKKILPRYRPNSLTSIYVNLGPDALADTIAARLHGQAGCRLGYYESLDNSVVVLRETHFSSPNLGSVAEGESGSVKEGKHVDGDPSEWFFGIMNHELVHVMMYAEHPGAPVWVNEGVAALYEQRTADDFEDNYRLYYLRGALRGCPGLEIERFVGTCTGTWQSYPVEAAYARYLVWFLYEAGRLGALLDASDETWDLGAMVERAGDGKTPLDTRFSTFLAQHEKAPNPWSRHAEEIALVGEDYAISLCGKYEPARDDPPSTSVGPAPPAESPPEVVASQPTCACSESKNNGPSTCALATLSLVMAVRRRRRESHG